MVFVVGTHDISYSFPEGSNARPAVDIVMIIYITRLNDVRHDGIVLGNECTTQPQ